MHFGIGQVEVGSLDEIKEMKEIYLESLKSVRDKEGLSIAMLLVTDVFKEESTSKRSRSSLIHSSIRNIRSHMRGLIRGCTTFLVFSLGRSSSCLRR